MNLNNRIYQLAEFNSARYSSLYRCSRNMGVSALTIAFDTDPECETSLNGWPKSKEAFTEYLKAHTKSQNIIMLRGIDSYESSIETLARYGSDLFSCFIPRFLTPELLENGAIEFKLVDEIKDENYVYPLLLHGGGHLQVEHDPAFVLPDKVVADVKRNKCKILIHEIYEGHGFNCNKMKDFILKFSEYYDINLTSIGFLDANYLTPALQKMYGTTGFYFPYWESHVFPVYQGYMPIAQNLLRRLNNQTNFEYRFLNLNRRERYHRSIMAHFLYTYHNDKTLWSFLEVRHTPSIIEHSDVESDFLEQLPKIIDVELDTNETIINLDLQNKAWLNLVSETLFETSDTLFFSEKIYKPLLFGQPFILIGAPHSLKLLRKQGYQTFAPFINEGYDDIIDPTERMKEIFIEINRLANLPEDEIKRMERHFHDRYLHNHLNLVSRVSSKVEIYNVVNQVKEWVNT